MITILIIKEIEKNFQNKYKTVTIIKVVGNEQQNIMKTLKKDCKNKLKINIGNFMVKKRYKKRIWQKYI